MFLTICFLMLMTMTESTVLVDFTNENSLRNWRVVDDVVMGGRSSGRLALNKKGYAVFSGNVSLENNGGFSSIRYTPNPQEVSTFDTIRLKVKGDGKRYQFRIKSDRYDYHSYIHYFDTSGEWEEIELAFSDFYPAFRGRKLNMPNYPGSTISEISILVGNKIAESFQIEIAQISVTQQIQ